MPISIAPFPGPAHPEMPRASGGARGVPLRRPSRPTAKPRFHVRIKNLDEHARWDLLTAMIPEEMRAAWDHLANTPAMMLPKERCHRLRGAKVAHIWQYKPTTGHHHRIWYTVDEGAVVVLVVEVHVTHPK